MTIVLTPTETQIAIATTIDALLADHYDFAARQAAQTARAGHSSALWALLAETGLLGTEASEATGGIGGSFADTAVVLEALGRALVVVPFVPTIVLGIGLLTGDGHEWLIADIVAGRALVALASDAAAVVATAVDGGWHLCGAVKRVLGGDVADSFLVAATTTSGPSLFLVAAIAAGIERCAYVLYDGSGAADLVIDTVVTSDGLIGLNGEAQPALDLAADRGAAATAHEAVGAMNQICIMTAEYLKVRIQFGQPLARFQILQHRLVDMGIALEEARSMALLATAALDEAKPTERARAISAAKVKVGEAARFVGQTAVQLHGGIALTEDYPAGHYFKRLTMLARQFGDELFHLDRYVELAP